MKSFSFFSFCILFTFYVNVAFAQNQIIIGQILDAATNQPIKAVNIKVSNAFIGTATDRNGIFKISIPRFPVTMSFSHIAYEEETLRLKEYSDEVLTIYLLPESTELEEVVVSSEREEKVLSEIEEYSVQDFEIVGDKILRLEYFGSFKDQRLSLINLEGERLYDLPLTNVNRISECYKSCNDLVYLLNKNNALPVKVGEHNMVFAQAVPLDTFEQFIQTCKAISEDDIFYLVESVNGMNRDIRKYNLENKTMTAVRTIGDPNQIRNYINDLYRIKHGQKISNNNHRDITPSESRRIRNLQKEADFRATVFYKPEFPVYLFVEDKRLLILNHPEEKIEFYESGKLVKEVAIMYPANKKWLKKVVYDQKQERLYVLFKHKQGIIVKLLNTTDGTLETADLIPEAFYNLEKIRVHNGELFYLKSNLRNERELIRVELFN